MGARPLDSYFCLDHIRDVYYVLLLLLLHAYGACTEGIGEEKEHTKLPKEVPRYCISAIGWHQDCCHWRNDHER